MAKLPWCVGVLVVGEEGGEGFVVCKDIELAPLDEVAEPLDSLVDSRSSRSNVLYLVSALVNFL
ncbi:hypothetical protein SMA49_26405, partial [Escherichia coli]|uniref:hypothetical protein n=1 Tax=Escherichia coli TaxID=562 RepID=UPI00307B07C5